jgi:hypothetical protein
MRDRRSSSPLCWRRAKSCSIAHAHLGDTFRIRKASADFVEANADVDPWLRRQCGFISRTMVEEESDWIIGRVIWEGAAQARDSSRRLISELAGSPVHDVIDQGSVSWSISPVFHQVP